MPLLDYGSVIFTDMSQTVLDKLQKAENACIRFITNVSRFDRITPSYVSLGINKLKDRRIVAITSLAWKVMKTNQPLYLRELFNYSARHCDKLVIPTHRTSKYSNSFCVTVCRLYNDYSVHNYLNLASDCTLKQFLRQRLHETYV